MNTGHQANKKPKHARPNTARRVPKKELRIVTARSEGPGGQNQNKVNTKVSLFWLFKDSSILSDEEKERIALSPQFRNHINRVGEIYLHETTTRSQVLNRERALEKLNLLLAAALQRRRTRQPTKPSKASGERRLANKHARGEQKRQRQRPNNDGSHHSE